MDRLNEQSLSSTTVTQEDVGREENAHNWGHDCVYCTGCRKTIPLGSAALRLKDQGTGDSFFHNMACFNLWHR